MKKEKGIIPWICLIDNVKQLCDSSLESQLLKSNRCSTSTPIHNRPPVRWRYWPCIYQQVPIPQSYCRGNRL